MSLFFARHMCNDLKARGVHESYLQHKSTTYLRFEEGLEKADGVYFFRGNNRGTIIRAGMRDTECKT